MSAELPRTRARTSAAQSSSSSLLLDLPADLQRHILSALDLRSYFFSGQTCMYLRETTNDSRLLATLTLERNEPAEFTPEREQLLRRLADAGNAAACYRLGMAYAYHPRPTEERRAPLEDSAALLRRTMEVGNTVIAADAAYELWLLTRRLPTAAASSEELLNWAAAAGQNPARFAAHRARSSSRRPSDFAVSVDFAAAQRFLVAAFDEHPRDVTRFSVCRNPNCGRWGVRAREVRRRTDLGFPALQAPPGLPRCQGMHGMHCRTRYCSRFCQALHWPEHRRECSQPEPLPLPAPLPPQLGGEGLFDAMAVDAEA